MKKLRLAGIGCGARVQLYMKLATSMPNYYEVTAAADPVRERVEKIAELAANPQFRTFDSADALLAEDKLADVVMIGTQDNYHFEPCKKALEKGYDILLEKPIATSMEEIVELHNISTKLNRKVAVCYVLRYTPFYQKIKEIIESGALGRLISVNASEGVGLWHMAHSFVRGHWSKTKESSPMIVSKCCHDTDILTWLIGSDCKLVASFGSLSFFNESNAPKNAPDRCTDGCPIGSSCIYNAKLYADKHRAPWLGQIYDNFESATKKEIIQWLKESPWGRCVYHCDNTAVDHQVLAMAFKNGVTATFTMTAFETGRHLEIYGTKAVLKADDNNKSFDANVTVVDHNTSDISKFNITTSKEGYEAHNGGDQGLIESLYDQMSNGNNMRSSLSSSLQSHLIAFAAEHARQTGQTINLDEFYSRINPNPPR